MGLFLAFFPAFLLLSFLLAFLLSFFRSFLCHIKNSMNSRMDIKINSAYF